MKTAFKIFVPLLVLLSLILASCTPQATNEPVTTQAPEPTQAPVQPTEAPQVEPTEAPPAEPEKVTITWWLQSDPLAEYIVANIVEPFNAQSKTVQVEVTQQANRWDAIRTALAGGTGPDLVGTPGPAFAAQLADAGYLLPMDAYAEQYAWADTLLPWALNIGKVDGKLYSIPAEVETLVLYYNKTLFEEHGWQPPKTIDELTALCEQIKAAGIVPFAHANAEYRGANEWYVGEFLNHIAGPEKVYQALTGQIKWDDPDFVTAIDTLNTYQQNGWFMGGLDRYYTLTFGERDEMLSSGQAAMNIEGTWFIGTALILFGEKNDNPNEWDWVPMPSKTGDVIYDLGIGGSVSINQKSEHPDAAAEFLTYYYSPEVQAGLVNNGFNSGPVKLSAEALSGVDSRFAAIIEAMGKASQTGGYGYTSWTFFPPKTEALLIEVEKVWAGEQTSAEFLKAVQVQFDEEQAAGELPPIPTR